jgi:hypothetical protein
LVVRSVRRVSLAQGKAGMFQAVKRGRLGVVE